MASEADEIDGGFDFFHHDGTAKRQSDFVSDVRSMAEVIRLHNNRSLILEMSLSAFMVKSVRTRTQYLSLWKEAESNI